MRDDDELLRAWRGGDRSAGNELFERYFDQVFSFFAPKVSDEPADLVQRTFLALVEARDRFRGDVSFQAFLYAIARHELFGYFRAKKRDQRLDFGASSLHDLSPSPSSLLRRKDDQALLAEALRHLPLDLQITLELHYFESMKGPELAAILEIPEGTVRSRLRRGLEKLRAALERLGGGPREPWQDEQSLERWARDTRATERPRAAS
ncbi:MAG: sigma-70 family RNA polymerase sigma factor [Sandaracinaceae bacterium]|nr:sigma-70 family RNA polymerase sigma factor [Sandaracinaceae bacterium]